MSQNPNSNPNYNPYGQNPTNPNYPGPPGTAYGGSQPPSGPNPGTPGNPPYPSNPGNPAYPSNPAYPGATPNTPAYPSAMPPSGPGSGNNTPNSSYGYNPYAPPPPQGAGTGPNPYDPYAPTSMSQNSSPGYPAYSPPTNPQPGLVGGGLPPNLMPMQQPPPRRRGRGLTALISVIALIIIAGGILAFVLYNNSNTSRQITQNANLTATAQTQAQATQSATNVQATTTAVANTYPFSTKQILNDPLTDNTKGVNWDNDGTACAFSGNAYHINDKDTNTYEPCFATNTNYTNFTFQVEMVLNQGGDNTLGGLIFRANKANNQLYRLVFDDQGDCLVLVSVDTTGGHTRDLKDCQATQFNTGLGVTNTIGVVADNDNISVYVNSQLVTTISDPTYSHGQIGLEVEDQDAVSEAVFSNAEVWQLPA
jgi:type II secretory pathway pseudopilin PulG